MEAWLTPRSPSHTYHLRRGGTSTDDSATTRALHSGRQRRMVSYFFVHRGLSVYSIINALEEVHTILLLLN